MHSYKAAHQGSGLGVPYLHELVLRCAGDLIAVPRDSDRVTRICCTLGDTRLWMGYLKSHPLFSCALPANPEAVPALNAGGIDL